MINNTVIEVLDNEHGKRVIEFFKSKGVDTHDLKGTFCKADGDLRRFYGVIDELFGSYSRSEVIKSGADIITLPEAESEYPKVMEVSEFSDFHHSCKRVVFMEKKNTFIAWSGATTLEEAEDSLEANPWPYARDIEPEPDTWYAVLPDTNTDNIDPQGNAVAIFKHKYQAKQFGKEICIDNFIITETKEPYI